MKESETNGIRQEYLLSDGSIVTVFPKEWKEAKNGYYAYTFTVRKDKLSFQAKILRSPGKKSPQIEPTLELINSFMRMLKESYFGFADSYDAYDYGEKEGYDITDSEEMKLVRKYYRECEGIYNKFNKIMDRKAIDDLFRQIA